MTGSEEKAAYERIAKQFCNECRTLEELAARTLYLERRQLAQISAEEEQREVNSGEPEESRLVSDSVPEHNGIRQDPMLAEEERKSVSVAPAVIQMSDASQEKAAESIENVSSLPG